MIKFFRHIRKQLLSENRFSKYFIYALGEIVLVVIGILIALGINNAYGNKKERSDLNQYYQKIMTELDSNIVYFKYQVENRKQYQIEGKHVLNLLAQNNTDSLNSLLRQISIVKEINSISPSFPTIEEFLSQELFAKIENDELKAQFQNFSVMYKFLGLVDEYTIDQYQISIEPFLINNFNYYEITSGYYSEISIEGGPPSKTDAIFEDLRLWNVVSNKIETWQYEKDNLEWAINVQEKLKTLIEQEL